MHTGAFPLTKLAPNHNCVHVPQNEAWLSALRNAEKNVFIQTPNLNAEPLIPAIISAVKRGIDVYYYVCLGYNDAVSIVTTSWIVIILTAEGRAPPLPRRQQRIYFAQTLSVSKQ